MKVAYISVYRDGTLYAKAATQYVLACEAAGLDVVCRPISLKKNNLEQLICPAEHLEKKSMDNVDVVIQHILPQFYQYKHGVKNIGFLEWTTSNFGRSTWAESCNLMDEIWVSCKQNRDAAINSGVTKPIKVIPRPCNADKFCKLHKSLDIDHTNEKMIFYTITDITRNNNVSALIRAYYSSFSKRDNVVLAIRGQSENHSEQEVASVLQKSANDIKNAVHLYKDPNKYPPLLIITQKLSEEETYRLHSTCDVFVSTSHGCAWSAAAHDAMGFGNPLILNKYGGFIDLMGEDHDNIGWLIEGQPTYCFGMTDTFDYLYTGHEQWFDPNLTMLVEAMKNSYELFQTNRFQDMSQHAKKRAMELSYKNVGEKILKELEVDNAVSLV